MRTSFSTALAIAAAALPTALAHYNFDALIVNGDITEPYEYVRKTSNGNSPIEDATSKDIVCNAGGNDAATRAATKTHKVSPGDEVGFTVASDIGHPGPLAVYLSKAPEGTEASDYLGDGDWFKVYSMTTREFTDDGVQWANYLGDNQQGITNFTFTLPEDTPSGTYLMRAEHVGLHAAGSKNGAQFYIGCAQITVDGSGSGSPAPTVKFPGAYTGEEPGLLLSIYYPPLKSYDTPGPKVWPSGCEDHTPNFVGQTSDGDCTNDDGASSGGSGSGSGSESPASDAPSAPSAPAPTASAPSNGTAPAPTNLADAPVAPVAPAQPQETSEAAAPVATKAPSAGGSKCSARRRKAKRAARALKRKN